MVPASEGWLGSGGGDATGRALGGAPSGKGSEEGWAKKCLVPLPTAPREISGNRLQEAVFPVCGLPALLSPRAHAWMGFVVLSRRKVGCRGGLAAWGKRDSFSL